MDEDRSSLIIRRTDDTSAVWAQGKGASLICLARKEFEKSSAASQVPQTMPRSARLILPGSPYHVTQRGTDRQIVFHTQ